MNREMKAIDLNRRCAAPGEDDQRIDGIHIQFAMSVYLSPQAQRRLVDFIQGLVAEPKNLPEEGLHWLSTVGGDDSTLFFESSCRSFNSDKERARALEDRRPSQFTCPRCGGHSFGSNMDVAGWVRYCNGRGQRVRFKAGKAEPLEGPDEPQIRCDFTWPESDDLKYGLKPPTSA